MIVGLVDRFFTDLTGHAKPWEFQRETARLILGGKSLILRAPTGSGKTWATIVPFLFSKFQGTPIADRLIYVLPLRSLARNLQKTTDEAIRKQGLNVRVTLQSGEEQNDPYFQGDIVFTTIDQLLSSYLMHPVSLDTSGGNISAGALPGSLIVLDEFHLLDATLAMGTAIEMVDRLRSVAQFVVMSATLTDAAMSWLAKKLSAQLLEPAAEELLKIQGDRIRLWNWTGRPLSAADISESAGRKTLVICNTVRRAQTLFRELQDKVGHETRLLLLHSRYFSTDRREIESAVLKNFERSSPDEPVIAVTTQVIEAGMDISCLSLYTELAPMNSLIQRAGRCARFRGQGKVFVSELEHPDRPEPYDMALAERTRQYLQGLKANGAFDFSRECEAIDFVHTVTEQEALRHFENLSSRRLEVNRALCDPDRSCLSRLVRDAQSVQVIVTSRPEEVDLSGRKGWPLTIPVPPTSFYAVSKVQTGEWMLKAARYKEENEGIRTIEWDILEPHACQSAWIVAAHPGVASYDPLIGLELGRPGKTETVQYKEPDVFQRYRYVRESFVDHTRRVVGQARRLAQCHRIGQERLAACFGVPAAVVEEALCYAAALHDTGKLAKDWQDGAKNYQQKKTPGWIPEPLAHTEFDPSHDQDFRRPSHAMEGAFAVCEGLFRHWQKCLDEPQALVLTRIVVSAIARHHTAFARRAPRLFSFPVEGHCALTEALTCSGLVPLESVRPPEDKTEAENFSQELFDASRNQDVEFWPLYAMVCRHLRLSDQAGTKEGTQA